MLWTLLFTQVWIILLFLSPQQILSFSIPLDSNRDNKMANIDTAPSTASASHSNATHTPASPTDVRQAFSAEAAEAHNKTLQSDGESSITLPLAKCRSLILELTVLVGNLSQIVLTSLPLDQPPSAPSDAPYRANAPLRQSAAIVLRQLWRIATAANLDLETCIHKKMALNRQKYPVNLCKVSWI